MRDRLPRSSEQGRGWRRCVAFGTVLLFLSAVSGCVYPLEGRDGDPGEYTTSFALSVKNVGSTVPSTKMNGTVVQSDGTFRGIERLYVVPFHTDGAVSVMADNPRHGGRNVDLNSIGIGSNDLISGNNAHLFDDVVMPNLMNRVLVYGKATDVIVSESEKKRKQRNGVLTPVGLDSPSLASDISFSLESILENDELQAVEDMSDELIAALNGVVTAIRNSGEPSFNGIFQYAEDQILACSYSTFFSIQENVQSMIFGYHGPGVAAIGAALNNFAVKLGNAGKNFPASYGIPEGAVGFWWNGKEFRRLISGVNINLVPISSYSFPPNLWYFANSQVRTSKDPSVKNEYVPENESWTGILSHYVDGATVLYSTQSVALYDQLQYGVSLLELSLSANVVAAAQGCPLTGIIVGDQKDVDFEFKPTTAQNDIRRFVYDLVDNGPVLGSSGSAPIPTLLLQTTAGEPVHFALEFKNNKSTKLRGQQGDILPGCKFYLAGVLDPAAVVGPAQVFSTSVFCQDCKTTISVMVESIEHAYNTVPDLNSPQLEVGIVAEMKWSQVTPQSLKLNL